MRLLASTGPLFARPLDWGLAVLAEAGYDGAELMVTRDPVTQDPERVRALATREGLATPVVHGPFLLVTRRVFGTDLVTKADRSLRLAAEVGADLVVVHPPLRWQRGFHRWLLARPAAMTGPPTSTAEPTPATTDTDGVRIGVENLYPVSVGRRQVRLHRYTEPRHLIPFRDIVLDTSHLGVAGVDLGEAYSRLREKMVHLHVSDNRGEGRDSHAPLGEGRLPLARFLRTIGDDERRGIGRVGNGDASITLELDCRRYLEDRTALVNFLRDERHKARALLDGADAVEVLGRPDDVGPAADADDADAPTAPPIRGSLWD